MTDTLELPTKYPSSRGDIDINSMAFTHLINATGKWRAEHGDDKMTIALQRRIAYLDSLPDDQARIAATTPADKGPVVMVGSTLYYADGMPVSNAAPIGHNNPPVETVVWTRDLIRSRIEDLYEQAEGILDGQAIENEGQAELVAKLKAMIAEAEGEAEKLRVAEVAPLNAALASIQEYYNPLIGKTTKLTGLTKRAIAACQALLTPWLVKQADELEAKRRAAAIEAEAKIEAVQTLGGAADMTRLGDADEVQEAVVEARGAIRQANSLENERARVTPGMGLRGTLLKDNWTATMEDADAAMEWAWTYHRAEVEVHLNMLAAQAVKKGKREIPGFVVVNDRRAG